ncbi:protein of unknown function [Pararobbsia alpina]
MQARRRDIDGGILVRHPAGSLAVLSFYAAIRLNGPQKGVGAMPCRARVPCPLTGRM